jgi:N-acetylglucosamine malate deacetylase 1
MADIMLIGAHPDDIEFGMGATAVKLCKEKSVVMVVLTRGEMGTNGTADEREKETKDAAAFLGAELEILDFKDCHIHDDGPSRLKIANIIRKYKPKIVFAPYFEHKTNHKDGVSHPDHEATGLIVRSALRFAKFKKIELDYEAHMVDNILYYMIPRFKKPTFISDVSQYMDDWDVLARKHQSQMKSVSLDRLKNWRRYYGDFIKADFGEAFIVEEPLKLDIEYLFRM